MSDKSLNNTVIEQPGNGTNQPLINASNFQLLVESQRRISQTTGISPTIRILVNSLVSKEQIVKVESKLIEQFSKLNQV